MSKRKLFVLFLVVVFAFSVTAWAVMPAVGSDAHSAPIKLGVIKVLDLRTVVNDPECPAPGVPGC